MAQIVQPNQMQTGINTTQNPAVVNAQNPVNNAQKYSKIYQGLGAALLLLGVVSVFLSAYTIVVAARGLGLGTAYIGTGIWGGGFFIASGGLSYASGKNPSYCNIVGGMVVSIFSALCAIVLFAFSIIGSISFGTDATANILLTMIAFVVFILSIVHSAFCCAGMSCCNTNNQQMQVVYASQVPQQYVAQDQQYYQNVDQQIPNQQQQQYLYAQQQQPYQQVSDHFTPPPAYTPQSNVENQEKLTQL